MWNSRILFILKHFLLISEGVGNKMIAVNNFLLILALFAFIDQATSKERFEGRKRLTAWLKKFGFRDNLNMYLDSSHPIYEIFFKGWGEHNLGKRLQPPNSLHMRWLWNDEFANAVRRAALVDVYD